MSTSVDPEPAPECSAREHILVGRGGHRLTGALAKEGGRGGPGDRALPHVEDALAVMKVINRNLRGRPEGELFEELRMGERCLRRASAELVLDYGGL